MYISKRKARHATIPFKAVVPTEEDIAQQSLSGGADTYSNASADSSGDKDAGVIISDAAVELDVVPPELERQIYLREVVTSDADIAVNSQKEIPMTPSTSNVEGTDGHFVTKNPQVLDRGDESTLDITYAEFLEKNTGEGILRVRAFAGEGSIPLVNVNVEVYKDFADGRHVFYHVVTNADGVADSMKLAAPPIENSILENAADPYASYSIRAWREGLLSETVENVPIFDAVRSIQPITLSADVSEEG